MIDEPGIDNEAPAEISPAVHLEDRASAGGAAMFFAVLSVLAAIGFVMFGMEWNSAVATIQLPA